jgi:hypothetical protein
MTNDTDATTASRIIRVGFALRKEKARKHVRAELVEEARARGIHIVVIDEALPLEQQGPFDVILQKIRRPEFERELEEYKKRHPEVHLCDPPSATLLLRNRQSMLRVLPEEGVELAGYNRAEACRVGEGNRIWKGEGASGGVDVPFFGQIALGGRQGGVP